MKTEIKKLDKLKRVIKIEVDEDILTKDKRDIYKELSKGLKVPGFRPGSAPLEIVEKHHKNALKEEFLKRIIPSYYAKALEDNNLEAASAPRIYDIDFDDKKLLFYAELEVRPEVELKDDDYMNLKIKNKPVNVEEIEVEKLITQLKDNVKKMINKDYDDQALAKWAGYPSVETFKEAIKAEILIDKLRTRRASIDNFITEELIKRIKIEVPRSLVEEQHQKLIQQEMYNLRLKGMQEKDIKKHEKEIGERLKSIAIKQLKLYYILEAIAKKDSLKFESRNLFEAVIGYILSCAQYSV